MNLETKPPQTATLTDRNRHGPDPAAGTAGRPAGERDELRSKIGKYHVLEKIGEGGFAKVFRGRDPVLERTVAIKICTAMDAELLERFFREGEIAGELQHPNITTTLDFGVEDETPYMVEELLTGRDLSAILEDQVPETERKLEILLQVARGLGHAHELGVLHRDVKPSNIRVTDDGQVKIMDFGIARRMARGNTLTAAGYAVGTVGYQAPELLRCLPVDARVDVFAFGVLAYVLLSGRRPFTGRIFGEICHQIINYDPPTLADVWSRCPDQRISDLVEACLEKERDERIASMSEIVRELEAVLAGLPSGEGAGTSSTGLANLFGHVKRRWRVAVDGAAAALGGLVYALDGAASPLTASTQPASTSMDRAGHCESDETLEGERDVPQRTW